VVIATLSDDERASIAALAQWELVGLHMGLGTWIPNNLGLWKGNNAPIQAIRERDHAMHPDDASMVIVEAVWDRLREMVPKVH